MTIIAQTIASASKRDYAWLLSALAKWSGNRTDLADLMPDFVMLAEKRLNADLESRHQEAVVNIMTEAGVSTVAVPIDTAEIRSLSLAEHGPLDYYAPDPFNAKFPDQTGGAPRGYTVVGPSIYLGPVPDGAYTLSLAYRAYVPALADSAGTNWLIENFPNAYLAASMVELCSYTKNREDRAEWEQKYLIALESVNKPDWTTAASMCVRTDNNRG
jgi:hypothetical protein